MLIVDDSPDHAELLKIAGRRVAPNVEFRAVGDGRQAIEYIHAVDPYHDRQSWPYPDLILLDLMMPRLDGFGVLGRLQSHGWDNPVPIVVLTTSSNPVDEARAMALGADAFFSKPSGVDALAALLQEIVRTWLT